MRSVEVIERLLCSGDRFLSLTEVAVHYGKSRQLVCMWRKKYPDFPVPVVELRTGPIWLLSQFDGLKFGVDGGYRQGVKGSKPRNSTSPSGLRPFRKGGADGFPDVRQNDAK